MSDNSQFALLATIESEAVVPVKTLPAESSNFYDNLSVLAPHIKPDEALYIFLRRDDTANGFIAIIYVPMAAQVSNKFLFGSTTMRLVRDLGIERFEEKLDVGKAWELTKEGWEAHEKHLTMAPPLTEEETVLGEVKRKEEEEGAGMSARKSHVGGSAVEVKVSEQAKEALKALNGTDGDNLVQLKITNGVTELASTSSTDLASLPSALSPNEPRFSFFRHADGSIFLVYTCPSATKPFQDKMIHATSKGNVQIFAEQEAGLKIAKKIEESEPSDLALGDFEEEKPKVEVKKAFARPPRPGRKPKVL